MEHWYSIPVDRGADIAIAITHFSATRSLNALCAPPLQMTRDWWQTDPTYVIDDPPKGFERPPILDNALHTFAVMHARTHYYDIFIRFTRV